MCSSAGDAQQRGGHSAARRDNTSNTGRHPQAARTPSSAGGHHQQRGGTPQRPRGGTTSSAVKKCGYYISFSSRLSRRISLELFLFSFTLFAAEMKEEDAKTTLFIFWSFMFIARRGCLEIPRIKCLFLNSEKFCTVVQYHMRVLSLRRRKNNTKYKKVWL